MSAQTEELILLRRENADLKQQLKLATEERDCCARTVDRITAEMLLAERKKIPIPAFILRAIR